MNFAYLAAFKKLIDKSPKGIENTTLAKPLLLKMTPEERRNAIEYLLKKQNPLLYINSSLIEAIDQQEAIAYDKIADLVLKEPKPTVQQVKLLRSAIERMPEDEKQDFFEKMVSSPSRITFTMIKDIAAPLKEFKESFLQKKNLKSLIENNLKYADLLIATDSADKLFEIYEVEDKAELLQKLSENKETFDLLKFLVVREFIDSNLIAEHMDDLNKEAQDFIKNDKRLAPFAAKTAR